MEYLLNNRLAKQQDPAESAYSILNIVTCHINPGEPHGHTCGYTPQDRL
jgi:hypothetical protein